GRSAARLDEEAAALKHVVPRLGNRRRRHNRLRLLTDAGCGYEEDKKRARRNGDAAPDCFQRPITRLCHEFSLSADSHDFCVARIISRVSDARHEKRTSDTLQRFPSASVAVTL